MSIAKNGYFGEFGGSFIPENLQKVMNIIEKEFLKYKVIQSLTQKSILIETICGSRKSFYYAKNLTEHFGGAKIYLKREDLNHTGAHKINNAIGQILLAKRMGKKNHCRNRCRATWGCNCDCCALLGLECKVFMGEVDTNGKNLTYFV